MCHWLASGISKKHFVFYFCYNALTLHSVFDFFPNSSGSLVSQQVKHWCVFENVRKSVCLAVYSSIESQNSWGWKRCLDIILCNCPAQPELSVADCPGQCPYSFDYLQGQRLHLSGQPVPVLSHLYTVKTCFLMFRLNLLCFSECTVSGHHWKEPGSVFFTLSIFFMLSLYLFIYW